MKDQINKMLIEAEKLQENNQIRCFVLNDLKDEDDPKAFIEQVLQHGCVSGSVTSLIYYRETREFFSLYFEEIHTILDEIKEEIGEEFSNYKSGTRYNDLAWLGYEVTLRQIALDLGLDY